MKENQRKIEEQQKKMVSVSQPVIKSVQDNFFNSGGGKTQDDRGANEDRGR